MDLCGFGVGSTVGYKVVTGLLPVLLAWELLQCTVGTRYTEFSVRLMYRLAQIPTMHYEATNFKCIICMSEDCGHIFKRI